ncbi:MAG: hypothetical protein AB7V00_03040 [Bacilli bacterium]
MNDEIKEQTTDIEQKNDEVGKTKEQIFEIEIKMQEIDVIIEKFEDELYGSNTEGKDIAKEEQDKIRQLKQQYRELFQQKKQLQKTLKVSLWDNFPFWMGLYAIFQFIFSFYLILTQISTYFAQWFFPLVNGSTDFLFYFSLFIIPFLNLVLSLIILLLLKNKTHKKIFLYIYLIHGIETLMAAGMLLYVVLQ